MPRRLSPSRFFAATAAPPRPQTAALLRHSPLCSRAPLQVAEIEVHGIAKAGRSGHTDKSSLT
jgi:hypothetical protein